MAEEGQKKIGRPRSEQTLPLILSQCRTKVLREYPVEAPTAQMIEDYSGWAAEASGITREEARMLLIGRSVDAFVKKDILFKKFVDDQKRGDLQ